MTLKSIKHKLYNNRYLSAAIILTIIANIIIFFWNHIFLQTNKITGALNIYIYGMLFGNIILQTLMPVISVFFCLDKISLESRNISFKQYIRLIGRALIGYLLSQIILVIICYIIEPSTSVFLIDLDGIFQSAVKSPIGYILLYWAYSAIFIVLYSSIGAILFYNFKKVHIALFYPMLFSHLMLFIPSLFPAASRYILYYILPLQYDIGVISFDFWMYLLNFACSFLGIGLFMTIKKLYIYKRSKVL